jgi:hypothetical protein
MDYRAKYAETYADVAAWGRTRSAAARLAATNALAGLSTKLSIVAVLGIGSIAILPQQAASTLRSARLAATPPPIEIVRPKQVIIDEADPAEAVELIASRRQRRRAAEAEPPEPVRKGSSIAVEPEPSPAPSAASNPAPDAPAEAAQGEPPKPDVWSDAEVIGALRECIRQLAPIVAEVDVVAPVKQDQCGTPAPVMLRRVATGSTRVEIKPPAMVNCTMVAHLHEWVTTILQPAAEQAFGSPITRLANASGYACRQRNGSQSHSERLSEHALANAIDIAGFVTADGRTIEVARHWGPTLRDQREATRSAAAPATARRPPLNPNPPRPRNGRRAPSRAKAAGTGSGLPRAPETKPAGPRSASAGARRPSARPRQRRRSARRARRRRPVPRVRSCAACTRGRVAFSAPCWDRRPTKPTATTSTSTWRRAGAAPFANRPVPHFELIDRTRARA